MIKISDFKYNSILICLTITGFILRLIAALNLDVFADDMLYASQSAGIIKAGILSTHSNPPLFFYLTDLTYKIFGYSTFASRFWPLIAGTMLIPLVFFLTDSLFKNKKIALFSAFFVTFSTFLIRMTFTEQSLLVLFFVFSSVLFLLNYLSSKKTIWLYLFGIGFGLGMLTKYSTPFFLLGFAVFLGYFYEQKKEFFKDKFDIKKIFLILGIIIFLSLPFLAFNLFIYKENGILDVYFSRIIHTDKSDALYGGLAGQGESFFTKLTSLKTYTQYKLPFITDPIITLFALFALFLLFKRKENIQFYFIIIMLLIPFILQSAGSGLQKHFAFIPFILSMPAAIGLIDIKNRIKSNNMKIVFLSFVFVCMLVSLGTTYGTPPNLIESSATSELKSFINDKVGKENLLILDSRIYTAKSLWLASPNSLILSSQFPDIYNITLNLPKERLKPIEVFYVECAVDDCGWGWVQNDQNLNQTSEQIASVFAHQGILIKSISAPLRTTQEFLNSAEEVETYKVYYLTLNLPPEILPESKKIQEFYFTPYLYTSMDNYIFNYSKEGINSFIDLISRLIIYIAMILSILMFAGFIWILVKNK